VSSAHYPSTQQQARLSRVNSRLSFNEQLRLFAPANELPAPETSLRPWALLALALTVLPWAFVGLMIWVLT
jgi:hypothetical protein